MIQITATAHGGLVVTVDGLAADLAVIDRMGRVRATGEPVAQAAESAATQAYCNYLKAQGHLQVLVEVKSP